MHEALKIEPLGDSDDSMRFKQFFFLGNEASFTIYRLAEGISWLAHSSAKIYGQNTKRVVTQYIIKGSDLVALDRTVFEFTPRGFAEVAQYREEGGSNLHLSPIRLPHELQINEDYRPFPDKDALVRSIFSGRARLSLGQQKEIRRVACIQAQEGETRQFLWLCEGVGEIAIGEHVDIYSRWAVGWQSGDAKLFEGVPKFLRSAGLPGLRARQSKLKPRKSLF